MDAIAKDLESPAQAPCARFPLPHPDEPVRCLCRRKGYGGLPSGAVKLINSLGRSSNVVRLETIDPERTIIRFNLDDLGWRRSDWDTILSGYPYGVQPDTQMFRFIQSTTDTPLPYIRADWFAFTAAQPPLYTDC